MKFERPEWLKSADKFLAAFLRTFALNFLLFPLLVFVLPFLVNTPVSEILDTVGFVLLPLLFAYVWGLTIAARAVIPGVLAAGLSFRLLNPLLERYLNQRASARIAFSACAGLGALFGLATAFRITSPSASPEPMGLFDPLVQVNAVCASIIGYLVARGVWLDESVHV